MSRQPVEGAARADVSVAVCTRDRTEMLRRLLESLALQSRSPGEVLVVDNAPSDESTRRLVEAGSGGARYLREEIPGLDFARNRALAEARCRVVAFIDDDAVADPGWVAAIERAFGDEPEIGACTGRIEALSLETAAQRLFEANGGLFAAHRHKLRIPDDLRSTWWRRLVPDVAWAAGAGSGCNLAVDREAAASLGGFDEALDLGAELPGGGDNDMIWRLLASGRRVVFEPASSVRHEHRRDMEGVERQILGHQEALVALATKAAFETAGWARLPAIAYLLWRLGKPGLRLVRRALGRDPLPARLLLRIWGRCFAGLGAYERGRSEARRRRERTALTSTSRARSTAGR